MSSEIQKQLFHINAYFKFFLSPLSKGGVEDKKIQDLFPENSVTSRTSAFFASLEPFQNTQAKPIAAKLTQQFTNFTQLLTKSNQQTRVSKELINQAQSIQKTIDTLSTTFKKQGSSAQQENLVQDIPGDLKDRHTQAILKGVYKKEIAELNRYLPGLISEAQILVDRIIDGAYGQELKNSWIESSDALLSKEAFFKLLFVDMVDRDQDMCRIKMFTENCDQNDVEKMTSALKNRTELKKEIAAYLLDTTGTTSLPELTFFNTLVAQIGKGCNRKKFKRLLNILSLKYSPSDIVLQEAVFTTSKPKKLIGLIQNKTMKELVGKVFKLVLQRDKLHILGRFGRNKTFLKAFKKNKLAQNVVQIDNLLKKASDKNEALTKNIVALRTALASSRPATILPFLRSLDFEEPRVVEFSSDQGSIYASQEANGDFPKALRVVYDKICFSKKSVVKEFINGLVKDRVLKSRLEALLAKGEFHNKNNPKDVRLAAKSSNPTFLKSFLWYEIAEKRFSQNFGKLHECILEIKDPYWRSKLYQSIAIQKLDTSILQAVTFARYIEDQQMSYQFVIQLFTKITEKKGVEAAKSLLPATPSRLRAHALGGIALTCDRGSSEMLTEIKELDSSLYSRIEPLFQNKEGSFDTHSEGEEIERYLLHPSYTMDNREFHNSSEGEEDDNLDKVELFSDLESEDLSSSDAE